MVRNFHPNLNILKSSFFGLHDVGKDWEVIWKAVRSGECLKTGIAWVFLSYMNNPAYTKYTYDIYNSYTHILIYCKYILLSLAILHGFPFPHHFYESRCLVTALMVLDEFETHLDLCQFRLIRHLPILLWLAGIFQEMKKSTVGFLIRFWLVRGPMSWQWVQLCIGNAMDSSDGWIPWISTVWGGNWLVGSDLRSNRR